MVAFFAICGALGLLALFAIFMALKGMIEMVLL